MSTKNGAKLDRSNNGAGLYQLPSLTLKADLEQSVQTTPDITVLKSEHKGISKFEQPVILQQSPLWLRTILWVLMGVLGSFGSQFGCDIVWGSGSLQ